MNFKYNIIIILLGILTQGCTTAKRLMVHNVPKITDHKIFPTTSIKGSNSNAEHLFSTSTNFEMPNPEKWIVGKDISKKSIDQLFEETNTVAFLVLRNDTLLFERYYDEYNRDKEVLAFSATKVLISALLENALMDGYIRSYNQKVSDFIPVFKNISEDRIEICHLLNMTSGINHSEYGKLFQTIVTYYHPNLDKRIEKVKIDSPPGTKFVYKSIDYQILGRCIEIATQMSIEAYMKKKIWDVIHAKQLILTKDSEKGNERMFGGMALRPIDLLKFGSVFLHNGHFKKQQIVTKSWIDTIQHREYSNTWWGYKNGWWRDGYLKDGVLEDKDFFASGFGGQCMLVNPDLNTVILRLGKNKGGVSWHVSLSKLAYELNDIATNTPIFDQDISGLYNAKGVIQSTIRISTVKANEKWIMKEYDAHGKVINKVKLYPYDDSSIYNGIKLIRIIFIKKNDKIEGLIYDDGKTMVSEYFR